MKKLTIEFIKQKTKEMEPKYTCVSNKYINNYTKLKFKCSENHIFGMSWGNFQQGQRCSVCVECHEKAHKDIGCRPTDLTKESICNAVRRNSLIQ